MDSKAVTRFVYSVRDGLEERLWIRFARRNDSIRRKIRRLVGSEVGFIFSDMWGEEIGPHAPAITGVWAVIRSVAERDTVLVTMGEKVAARTFTHTLFRSLPRRIRPWPMHTAVSVSRLRRAVLHFTVSGRLAIAMNVGQFRGRTVLSLFSRLKSVFVNPL